MQNSDLMTKQKKKNNKERPQRVPSHPQAGKTNKATCLQAFFAPSLALHMTQLHFYCATQTCLSVVLAFAHVNSLRRQNVAETC